MPASLRISQNGHFTSDNYNMQTPDKLKHEWKINNNGIDYKLCVYGKTTGKFNAVNQYEFPPPISHILFYGDVSIVGYEKRKSAYQVVDLSVDQWKMFCQHTFQFESLKRSELADELEVDELSLVPSHLKTKHGYLKDGFVVDDDEEEDYY